MNYSLQDNKFQINGMTLDDLGVLKVYGGSFIKFLLDIQNGMRIQRAFNIDEGDKLLIGSQLIDQIIQELEPNRLLEKIEEIKEIINKKKKSKK